MAYEITKFYIDAASRQAGALGIFQLYSDDAVLAEHIDAAVIGHGGQISGSAMRSNALKYGWLRSADGRAIDEVMLAKPTAGMRVLTTHGGRAVRQAVGSFLKESGFMEINDLSTPCALKAQEIDPLLNPLLSACLTGSQVDAVLAAQERTTREGRICLPPPDILATHRMVLAGPPNSGKSSLLNAVAGYDRALVHADAGATRDVVDELVELGGYAVILGDLPGYMDATGGVDARAWAMAVRRLRLAELVFFVCDGSEPWGEPADRAARAVAEALGGNRRGAVIVVNKADLPRALRGDPWREHFPGAEAVWTSSRRGEHAAAVLGQLTYDRMASASAVIQF